MVHYKTIVAEFPEKVFTQYRPLSVNIRLGLSKHCDFNGLRTAFP